jgi:hypothetical protein
MGFVGHTARVTESILYTDVMVVKLMVKSPLGRCSLILEDNITTDLEEVGLGHGLE